MIALQSYINTFNSQTPAPQLSSRSFGFVYDVILDEENDWLKSNNITNRSAYVGAVLIRNSSDAVSSINDLTVAFPFDKNIKSVPLKNETVEIYKGNIGLTLYRRIGQEVSPNTNTNPNNNYYSNNSNITNVNDYKLSNSTGTSTVYDPKTDLKQLGKYFAATPIHKLKLYEGDLLIESRFGQSIRFSAYNNTGNKFSPSIIIRNKQNSFEDTNNLTKSVEENINADGSIIALTSNEYESKFIPGTVDKNGKGDFETTPDSFESYPDKLNGDQILINSGRVIISSKNGEMIFYSKKNYGFISDGTLSIDNKGGIEANLNADTNIVTNDMDFRIHSGNGSIFLGNTDLEPIPKGQQLVDLLAELIDAIAEQQYLTPSGPTKIGPENLPTFASIKTKLNVILSKQNQTS